MWEKQIAVLINETPSATSNRTLQFAVPEILEDAELILVDAAVGCGWPMQTSAFPCDQYIEVRLAGNALRNPHATDLSPNPTSDLVLGWLTSTKGAQNISSPGPIFVPASTLAADGMANSVWTITLVSLLLPGNELGSIPVSGTLVVLRIRGIRSAIERPPVRVGLVPMMRYQFRPADGIVNAQASRAGASFRINEIPKFEGPLSVTFDISATTTTTNPSNILTYLAAYGLSVPDATFVPLTGAVAPPADMGLGPPQGTPLIIGVNYAIRGSSANNNGNAGNNGRRAAVTLGSQIIGGMNWWPGANTWKVARIDDTITFIFVDQAAPAISGRLSQVVVDFCVTMTVRPYYPELEGDVFDELQ